MRSEENINAHQIVFGLSRQEDERSLADFLRLFAGQRLTSVLIPRMTDEEISQTVERLSRIMRNHLTEKEYHSLFLGESRQDT
ncbi:MAG TPA: cytoplasmic protein [Desulfobacteraceae bacterium]|nr:cytoplasmic protein [Desulfobacteraceae bacterium]